MTRLRALALLVVGLATAAALLPGAPAPAESASVPQTRAAQTPVAPATDRSAVRTLVRWSGFGIKATGTAAGGFVGARRWGKKGPVVYQVDPRGTAGRTAYRKARWVGRLRGSGRHVSADARSTARAAWIVSKYGRFRYDIQNAAVDAALLHLLAGKRWRLTGDLGLRRIRQTGHALDVRRFARTMLDDSLRLSGPYVVQVRQDRIPVVGDAVRLAIRVVVARNGRPLPYVPVRVTSPDGTANAGTTDEGGWVRLTYPHPSAGATPIRVRVGKAPETRLRLMDPKRRARSRLVVAGRKGVLDARGAVYVKARPRVNVGERVTRIRPGQPTKGAFKLVRSAESWPRQAVVTLHGPFAKPGKARCGARVARRGHVRVTAAGRYRLPRFELREQAYYIWRVQVPGNRVNLPAVDCGGRFRVYR